MESATQSDILVWSCYRVIDWEQLPVDSLVDSITQPSALIKMELQIFFNTIIALGGLGDEIAPFWQVSEFMSSLRQSLADGDLESVTILAAQAPYVAPNVINLSAPTLAAISATIASKTLRLVDSVAADYDIQIEAVTPSEVTLALNSAGWYWSGSAWQHGG